MGKLVNLRTIRKQKSRDDDRAASDVATRTAGIKKSEKARAAQVTALSNRKLDGHKRDGEP